MKPSHSTFSADSSICRRLPLLAALALVYFLAGKFGLSMAYVHRSATAVWPPTGIALFALLVFGYRVWPAIFAGAFAVNLVTDGAILTSLGIALGNTLEGLVGAYLVGRFANGRKTFEQYPSIFKFALLAAGVSTAVSATIGVTSLCLGGLAEWARYESIWLTWWSGDAGGDLIVAPLLILWSGAPSMPRTWAQISERFLMLICTFAIAGIAFGIFPGLQFPMAFLCLPLLAWAAFRFAQFEAATAIFLLAGLAIWGTVRGFGQFGVYPPEKSLLVLQAFLATLTLTTLTLSALVMQRRKAEDSLRRAGEELEKRVRERTAELRRANDSLRELSGRLVGAQEKERRRLARELHESTAQTLVALKMNLELAGDHGGAPDSSTASKLSGALTLTDQALQEIRTLAYLLYPPTLGNAGLGSLIPSFAEGFTRRSGIKVKVDLQAGLGRLPAEVEIALFHVVQESLTNIHLHSSSPTAEIRLSAKAGEILLAIKDAGRGIAPGELEEREVLGVGIRGMRETISLLGGRLEIASGNPGTIIRASLPIPDPIGHGKEVGSEDRGEPALTPDVRVIHSGLE